MSKVKQEKGDDKSDQKNMIDTNINDSINSDSDLKRALTFLLSKEMKEYSLEKRKEFLLKKLSPSVVEKAIDLYQTIEINMKNNIDEILKKNKQQSSKN